MSATLEAVVKNIYPAPSAEYLQERLNERLLQGYFKVSDLEIETFIDEGVVGILTARITAALDEMGNYTPDAVFFNWNWPRR